jgi:Protein of unknown function (DUF3352)
MKAWVTLLVAAVAASLLVAGCGGGESITGVRGASIVPATAAAFIAVDSDPDSSQWQNAMDLADKFPSRQKAIAQAEDSLRSESNLDFEKDVKPALGPELDLVWLDFENNGDNFVALMQPQDQDAFEKLVAKGNIQDPADKLLYEEVDGWQVMSDKQASIDAFKAAHDLKGPVLSDDDSFNQAMDDYAKPSIFKAYLSGKTVMDELRKELSPDDKDFLDKVGNLEWLALALRTTSDGIRFDTSVRGTPGELLRSSTGDATPNFELSLPKQLPADVLAYIGFHGAPGTFKGLQDNPLMESPELDQFRSIVGKIGTLVEGEDALYVRPNKNGDFPEITLVTTPRAGTDGAEALDGILKDAKVVDQVKPQVIAGLNARRISLGDSGPAINYATVGDKLVITTAPAGIESNANPTDTGEDSSLRDAIDASDVPDKVQSFFYVNVRGGLDLVEQLSGAPIPDSVKKNVKPLRSAVEYAASRPSEVQLTFFVRID